MKCIEFVSPGHIQRIYYVGNKVVFYELGEYEHARSKDYFNANLYLESYLKGNASWKNVQLSQQEIDDLKVRLL